MSDKILRALMQLFAIVANTDEIGFKGREIVERFLKRQLPQHFVEEYLIIYDDFLNSLKGKNEEGKIRKRTSVNSVKVLRICNDINKELEQKQKIIVLIRLFEFVNITLDAIVDQHIEFLNTVAETFGLSNTDRENCSLLVKGDFSNDNISLPNSFLVVDKHSILNNVTKHIQKEGLSGKLVFLTITDPFLILFNYTGSDYLILDGREIIPNSINVFEPGSVIRGAKFSPIYYNEIIHDFIEVDLTEKIHFQVNNLSYYFKKNKIGLYPLNFQTGSNNLVGIMGNSGAGKTTLLNILNGSVSPTNGKILINGLDLSNNKKLSNGLIGNIPQDDLLVEELSVFQNLFYSSKLFFGNLSDEEITDKVNNCLKSLMLFEIKDLLVGDPLNKFISGGQRKRLNIALELIREPAVLFVDEPTSGLSSGDAENVMDLLKQLTLAGKLIFVVIHQPSSTIFKLFDQLLVLDTGGYCVYFGNPVDSLSYFRQQMSFVDYEYGECPECGNINSEEIFRIIETKTIDEFGRATAERKIKPNEWYQLYNQNFEKQNNFEKQFNEPEPINQIKLSNPFIQFLVYFQRNVLSKLNNKQYIAITLFEGPILAFILAIALRSHETGKEYLFGTNPNIPVYMFICTIVSLFLGLITSAEEIIQDKKILKRESLLRLNRNSYLISKILFLFLVSLIQTMLFVLIGNTILGFPDLYMHYVLILFSVSCFGNLLGLNISSGMKTRVAVYILIPFLVIPQIMLSGVMVKFEDLNPTVSNKSGSPLIGNIMVTRWAFEGLAVDQFKNNQYEISFFPIEKQIVNSNYRKDYWNIQIENTVEQTSKILKNNDYSVDSIKQLESFFKEEFKEFSNEFPEIKIIDLENQSLVKEKEKFLELVKINLDSINKNCIRLSNSQSSYKDLLKAQLIKKIGSVENFINFKNNNYNDKLEDFVLNANEVKNQLVISDNTIIRRYKPIYAESLKESFFNAPFYSHSKAIGGVSMFTLWYNLIIIWLMTIILYIVLYYDVLKKVLEKKYSNTN